MNKSNLSILLLLCTTLTVTAQKPIDHEIDPRQYVAVTYKKSPTSKQDTVWNWENRQNVPYQKFKLLDLDGEIKITFDKASLANNTDFEGTFSLEAEISGAKGTRPIEVTPYSEIGIQRLPIGIKSEPPTEITTKIINIYRELSQVDSLYFLSHQDSLYFGLPQLLVFANNVQGWRNTLNQKVAEFNQSAVTPSISDQNLHRIVKQIEGLDMQVDISRDSYTSTSSGRALMTEKFEFHRQHIDLVLNGYEYYTRNNLRNTYRYVSDKTNIVLDYLNSFENSGQDALKAVLSLMGKDIVNYRTLKSRLSDTKKQLDKIEFPSIDIENRKTDSILNFNKNVIIQSMSDLVEISRFEGSKFERLIRLQFGKDTNAVSFTVPTREENVLKKKNIILIINKNEQEVTELISKEAAKIIYKRLIYATIDLGKSGAQAGEALSIYVTWILDPNRDSLANSPRLPIGRYALSETGWRYEIADMFALIKRVGEAKVNQTQVSPTNFKGSGGAVIMMTYHKQNKPLKVTQNDDGSFKVHSPNRLWNFLEPSIGLNVSYLDFSTEKDVEIGTGLQLGLFRNKIFFGYGVNLHMLSPSHQSPTYFYLGFSFAKLQDLFKNSNAVSSGAQ